MGLHLLLQGQGSATAVDAAWMAPAAGCLPAALLEGVPAQSPGCCRELGDCAAAADEVSGRS